MAFVGVSMMLAILLRKYFCYQANVKRESRRRGELLYRLAVLTAGCVGQSQGLPYQRTVFACLVNFPIASSDILIQILGSLDHVTQPVQRR